MLVMMANTLMQQGFQRLQKRQCAVENWRYPQPQWLATGGDQPVAVTLQDFIHIPVIGQRGGAQAGEGFSFCF